MFLGIDLGTSSLKVLLMDAAGAVRGSAESPHSISHPAPLQAEQNPEDWWQGLLLAMQKLKTAHPEALGQVRAIGLSGQMHGVVLLDAKQEVLRPAILWNDGRSSAECAELERREPLSRHITGNLAMPGFSAPKILWLAKHEPTVLAQTQMVLLPKDYLRFRLSGECVSDMSDASGTLWLDVGRRAWSPAMLAATGLRQNQLPRLVEGDAVACTLLPDLAALWGMAEAVVIAGGAGDNAASAVGMGVVQAGSGFVSLGTSGVVFLSSAAFTPVPEKAVHSFCHALGGRWHQMSVMLSCAASIDWGRRMLGLAHAKDLMDLAASISPERRQQAPLFLPYLNGERSPHNNPHASAAWLGLRATHDQADMAYAVVEGVCFGLKDGFLSLTGHEQVQQLWAVGGGSQSAVWLQLLADTLGVKLLLCDNAQAGAALGAARLAALSLGADLQTMDEQVNKIQAQYLPQKAVLLLLLPRFSHFQNYYSSAMHSQN